MSKVGDTESRNKPTAAPASAGRQKLFKNEGKDQEVSTFCFTEKFHNSKYEDILSRFSCYVTVLYDNNRITYFEK